MLRRPPRSTRTDTLFPYTTLFRSLPSIPVAAEVSGVRFWISLVEDTGARIHFCRLSTARGAELVGLAQQRGLPVTADVAAHQLFLTDADIDGFNALCHVMPPLRSAEDRDALRQAVADGVIGAIRSEEHTSELQSLMRLSYAVF